MIESAHEMISVSRPRFSVSVLWKKLSRPEIFNTDQGVRFTSTDFIKRLGKENIRISMDGRGPVFDNIFVERLWRSVKYEEVYLQQYTMISDVRRSLGKYFLFYNMERIHEALGIEPLTKYMSKSG